MYSTLSPGELHQLAGGSTYFSTLRQWKALCAFERYVSALFRRMGVLKEQEVLGELLDLKESPVQAWRNNGKIMISSV